MGLIAKLKIANIKNVKNNVPIISYLKNGIAII